MTSVNIPQQDTVISESNMKTFKLLILPGVKNIFEQN